MKSNIEKISVFCGSHIGERQEYIKAAQKLGKIMAQNNIELIYGGAAVGLMRQLSASVKKHGGRVTGVIPHFMCKKGLADNSIDNTIIVESMAARKEKLIELADAFIALPGGLGTLDEIFDVVTTLQLGLHNKPIGLANIHNFYDSLHEYIGKMIDEGFVNPEHKNLFIKSDSIEELFATIMTHKTPEINNYIETVRDKDHYNVIDNKK